MFRVETVFTTYRCPKVNEDVDVRIHRLRDVESQRILSQKFDCEKAAECCLTASMSGKPHSACPHPEAKPFAAHMENGTGT